MTWQRRTGATAAAVLPAALAGAALVSAPFAGTTTSPLGYSAPARAVATQTHHPAAMERPVAGRGVALVRSAPQR